MEIHQESLKQYSSLHIGGIGDVVTVATTMELVEAVMYAKTKSLRLHLLGEGTNTFFGDSLENILFVKMNIKGISFEEQGSSVVLKACAGENWDAVVELAVSRGLWGIENLSAIPGTVGAAPVQNIGAYGTELKDTFVSLEAIDTETANLVEISPLACQFGYRDSLFKQQPAKYAIISISLRLSKERNPVLNYKPLDTLASNADVTLKDIRNLVVATRKAKLPDYREFPNTGSFFKNPVVSKEAGKGLQEIYPDIKFIDHEGGYKIPAAWLIEHVAQAKGVKTGNVGTWPHQPLVLVNYGEATALEVLTFSGNIIKAIEEKTGIVLEREVNFVQ